MNIVLLGPPGAGKGTQAVAIRKHCGLVHVSTGELFRSALKDDSDLGRQVKEYLESGRLVPDKVTSTMVARRLDEPDCAAGCMLDGYPRTLQQAADLDELFAQRERILDFVLYFDVSEATAVDRLGGRRLCQACGAGYHIKYMPAKKENQCDACGGELMQRTDDMPDTIRDRLKVYGEQTSALVEEYDMRGLLYRLDANVSPTEITAAAMAILKVVGQSSTVPGRSKT